MNRREHAKTMTRIVLAYLLFLAALCAGVHVHYSLHPAAPGEVIASVWQHGALVYRGVVSEVDGKNPEIQAAMKDGASNLVYEKVVAESPVLTMFEPVFAASFVAGQDGLRVKLGDKTAYVTPDDLLSRQLYDKGLHLASLAVAIGLDAPPVLSLLAQNLGANPTQVIEQGSIERIRVERHTADPHPRVTAASFHRDDAMQFVGAAAHYLARGVTTEGNYRYSVDAPTNRANAGYDWPRHAGATFFLAQAGGLLHDDELKAACSRAAALLRGKALSSCAGLPCVGDEPVVSLGSSALALLAFAEIVDRGIDDSYRQTVVDLARFVRTQERTDGEFMHEYDRIAGRPIDVQGLYYSSEATLALARAYGITKDPADLDAAVRGLRNLVGPAWSFFGDRYYFGEEHWTCQAMAILWDYSPDPLALDFCVRWQEYGRALQQREGDAYYDADGAVGLGPIVTPRLTPVASRGEAAVATLDIAQRAGVDPRELGKLDEQLRRAFALLVRHQLRPGLHHLFRDPGAVYGGMPGSEVDWELRIDFAQHAGSAMVRWLETVGRETKSP